MSVRASSALALILACGITATARAQDPKSPEQSKSGLLLVTEKARLDDIARAALFEAHDITQLDTRRGRQLEQRQKDLPNDVTIECYYEQQAPDGTTPKFKCAGAKDPNDAKARLPVIVTDASGHPVDVKLDRIKVRYGSVKVFSSVITTRLAWALGFGSDIETPVARVICHGCSRDPFTQKGPVSETNEFPRPGDRPQVSVEQGMTGTGIAVSGMRFVRDNGEDTPAWRWQEVDLITEPSRAAEASALELFSAFIQHVDSKTIQNHLLCRSEADSSGVCSEPFMYVHDFGNTLGTRGGLLHATGGVLGILGDLLGIHTIHPLDLNQWRNVRVWKDAGQCIANLKMVTGDGPGLINPVISEPGRRLLAERLAMLISARNSDGSSKLRDIFDAAHIEKYDDHGQHHSADEWVDVFTARARQIIEKTEPCP